MNASPETHHITARQAITALNLLSEELTLSKTELKQAASNGCIWWQAAKQKPLRIRRLKKVLQAGEQLHCYIDTDIIRQVITPAVCVADEGDYSIWLKPRGMFSQATKWGDSNSISRFVELQLSRPTWLVHRLDRMTAGLIILSHRKTLVADFERAFKARLLKKSYVALINGQFNEAPMLIETPIEELDAKTELVASRYDGTNQQTLVDIRLHSGRKHQIRRHLAELGFPLVGDRLYGKKGDENEHDSDDLQLVAYALAFADPLSGEPRQYQLNLNQLQALMSPRASNLLDLMFSDKSRK